MPTLSASFLIQLRFTTKSTWFNQKLMPFTLGCPVEKHTCFSAILHRVSVECARMDGLHFNTGFHAKLVSGEIGLFVFFHMLARQHEKRIYCGTVHSHLRSNLSRCLMRRHQCCCIEAEIAGVLVSLCWNTNALCRSEWWVWRICRQLIDIGSLLSRLGIITIC